MKTRMAGMRVRIVRRLGEPLLLRTPEMEPKRAKRVVGMVKVKMSAAVKR